MEEKSALLDQLRIARNDVPPSDGGPPHRRLWLWGIALIVLAALALGFLLLRTHGIPVRAAVAQRVASETGASNSMLDATGYVVARRQATVSAKITGKVVEVLIEEGQHVEINTVVARLDDTNSRAALEHARAQYAQAQANLAAAKTALADAAPVYQRSEKQLSADLISAEVADTARANFNATQAAVTVAQRAGEVALAAQHIAERDQQDTVIRAPFSGVITVKAAQPGEIISPISAGGGFTRTGIGTIVDMDSLEMEVEVNESFISRVHANQPASVTLNAYSDWQIPAHLIAVIPTADRTKATVKVRVGLDKKDPRILPEMGARVSFLSAAPTASSAAPAGVVVPVDAVQANGEQGIVFLIHDVSVERRAVKLGARRGQNQLVLAGLAAGDRVAIGDFSKLKDQAHIVVQPEAEK